jgi:hypothetical protein
MISHRCKDCVWWDNQHPSIKLVNPHLGKAVLGFCRRRRAGALRIEDAFYGVHPVMDADEFCGEFKGVS